MLHAGTEREGMEAEPSVFLLLGTKWSLFEHLSNINRFKRIAIEAEIYVLVRALSKCDTDQDNRHGI